MRVPVWIDGIHATIETEVIEGDLPMLMGRGTMAKLGMIVNVDSGMVYFKHINKLLRLPSTPRGHIIFPLSKESSYMKNVVLVEETEGSSNATKESVPRMAQPSLPMSDQAAHLLKSQMF